MQSGRAPNRKPTTPNLHPMKHPLITLITFITLTTLRTTLCAASLGEWTHYHAYNDLTHVVPTGKAVYAVSAKALFSYNPGDETVTA